MGCVSIGSCGYIADVCVVLDNYSRPDVDFSTFYLFLLCTARVQEHDKSSLLPVNARGPIQYPPIVGLDVSFSA